ERSSFGAHERGEPIQAVAFSPDGTILVTAGFCEGDVRLWDAARGTPRGEIPTKSNGVNALAFLPHDPTLAMACANGTILLWNITSREEVGTFHTDGATLQSLAISPDGQQIATGGTDGAVRVWDVKQAIRDTPTGRPSDDSR